MAKPKFLERVSVRVIVLLVCCAFLLVTIIASVAFYRLGSDQLTALVKNNAENSLEQTCGSLEQSIETVDDIIEHLLSTRLFYIFQNKLAKNGLPLSPKEYFTLSKDLRGVFQQNSHILESITLYVDNNSIMLIENRSMATVQGLNFDVEYYYSNFPANQPYWLNLEQDYPLILSDYQPPALGVIYLLGTPDSHNKGFLLLEFRDEYILSQIKNTKISPSSLTGIVQEGQLLYLVEEGEQTNIESFLAQENQQAIVELSGDSKAGKFLSKPTESKQIFYQRIGGSGLTQQLGIVYGVPLEEFYADNQFFARLLAVVLLIVLLASVGIFILVSALISKPVVRLERKLKESSADGSSPIMRVTGSKEISAIDGAINDMLDRTSLLIQTLNIEMENKRQAELRLLQAQINPHFLYNTLDSIHQLCELEETEQAKELTQELAMFYRMGLGKGADQVSLEDELTHSAMYLSILYTRFGDFTYEIVVPEEFYQCTIVKITLQPLVENAIIHGIRPALTPGHIALGAYREGKDLILTVTDDGVGIPEDILKSLCSYLRAPVPEAGAMPKRMYGIRNVNDRLRLTYGSEYGLTIESKVDKGTMVRVKIPYQTI